jgi:site-specific DNA-methyltransferase (adenine-specific)
MTTIQKLRRNAIYQGDCMELLRLVPTQSIDLILCDLPYGTTRNKWDSLLPLPELWTYYNRIIKEHGAIVLFAQAPFDKILGASNLEMLRYEWIWQKELGTGHLNARKMPLKNHENILVFYKSLPVYNPQMWMSKPYVAKGRGPSSNYGRYDSTVTISNGERYPLSVVKFNRDATRLHPTQKPLALCEYLIRTYTNEGGLVLDNCMGSGTTIVAAINTGRRYLGFEKEEKYFAIAHERIEEALQLANQIA